MTQGTVLILGAQSDIAKSIANKFAANGHNLLLASRRSSNFGDEISDLKLQFNVDVNFYEFDVLKLDTHKAFIQNLKEIPSIVICAIGLMGDQNECEKKDDLRTKVLRTNFEGPVNIISEFSNIFENRGSGTIVGISSVAGERGRSSNYIYGSAKAGLTKFLSGLRNRLSKKNVHVITVLPGPVFTKMTKNKKLPKILTATPNQVAKDVFTAVIKKKDIIYTFKIWKLIMTIIKIIPEKIFKKMNI